MIKITHDKNLKVKTMHVIACISSILLDEFYTNIKISR